MGRKLKWAGIRVGQVGQYDICKQKFSFLFRFIALPPCLYRWPVFKHTKVNSVIFGFLLGQVCFELGV